MTLTPIVEHLAGELSLPALTTNLKVFRGWYSNSHYSGFEKNALIDCTITATMWYVCTNTFNRMKQYKLIWPGATFFSPHAEGQLIECFPRSDGKSVILPYLQYHFYQNN